MKKIQFLLLFYSVSANCQPQFIGNIVSVNPNSANQGQTLVTTITQPQGSWVYASPPCDNYGIYLIQGSDTIFSNSYLGGIDMLDAEFTIPAAAALGFYDVYVVGGTWDIWMGTCTPIYYWNLIGGFEVTLGTDVSGLDGSDYPARVSPNPFRENGLLTFSNEGRKQYRISVRDMLGKEIFTGLTDKGQVALSRKDFESGIYFYRLEGLENKFSATGKFVVID